MNRLPLALLLSVATGCTETIELAHDPLEGLVELELVPGDATIRITDLAPPNHTLQYQAMGRFHDGSTRDVTQNVTWMIDDDTLGSFDPPGLFVASHAAVGRGRVSIATRDLSSMALLEVVVDATIVDATFPPPGPNLFDPAKPVVSGDPLRSPRLLYPADATLFPHVVARTLFQLARGDSNDAVRLTFDNDLLHLRVDTGGDRWATDETVQRLLASAGVVAPLQTQLFATSAAAPGSVYAGAIGTLRFSQDLPRTAVYFWSSATSGIMRGNLDATSATKLDAGSTTCVGCHAMSRDGTLIAMATDNGVTFELQALEVETLQTTIAPTSARPMGFAAYSPDGTRLVVANDGALALYDARTGTSLGAVPVPANRYATHPDWSPDGTSLAIALTAQTPTNYDVRAASIAVMSYNAGTWGAPQVLVTGSNSNNNYFPRWSPDGQKLAFVRATTASRGALSAELMLIGAGGGTPMPLQVANRAVGAGEAIDLANTMPAWGPRFGDRAWLAFASARPYGAIAPAGGGQIWVTSVDLTATSDSSSPAFWLPCQDVTALNINPVWPSEVITQ